MQSADIVENKRLGAALALIQAQQDAYPANKRRRDPARYRHINNPDIPTAPAT